MANDNDTAAASNAGGTDDDSKKKKKNFAGAKGQPGDGAVAGGKAFLIYDLRFTICYAGSPATK